MTLASKRTTRPSRHSLIATCSARASSSAEGFRFLYNGGAMRLPGVRVFTRNHGLNCSKTVAQGVVLNGLNPLRGFRASRLKGVLAVCFQLLATGHSLIPREPRAFPSRRYQQF